MCLLHVNAGTRFQDLVCYPEISIRETSMTFLTGPSGCDKSTLLRLLNATAILYQIAVMIAICTVVTAASFGSLFVGLRTLYDPKTQIL